MYGEPGRSVPISFLQFRVTRFVPRGSLSQAPVPPLAFLTGREFFSIFGGRYGSGTRLFSRRRHAEVPRLGLLSPGFYPSGLYFALGGSYFRMLVIPCCLFLESLWKERISLFSFSFPLASFFPSFSVKALRRSLSFSFVDTVDGASTLCWIPMLVTGYFPANFPPPRRSPYVPVSLPIGVDKFAFSMISWLVSLCSSLHFRAAPLKFRQLPGFAIERCPPPLGPNAAHDKPCESPRE